MLQRELRIPTDRDLPTYIMCRMDDSVRGCLLPLRDDAGILMIAWSCSRDMVAAPSRRLRGNVGGCWGWVAIMSSRHSETRENRMFFRDPEGLIRDDDVCYLTCSLFCSTKVSALTGDLPQGEKLHGAIVMTKIKLERCNVLIVMKLNDYI